MKLFLIAGRQKMICVTGLKKISKQNYDEKTYYRLAGLSMPLKNFPHIVSFPRVVAVL